MEARFSLFGNPVAAKVLKHLISSGKVVSDSTLPADDYQPGQFA
jgi:hypothetical protein